MSADHLKEINFCPSCGGPDFSRGYSNSWQCKHCEFIYFHNAAAAVAAILMNGDEILLTVRKNDPGKGMLDLPGGFVDPGESLEEAVTREINEELKCRFESWEYLFSYPNRYVYKGIVYRTSDAFFKIQLDEKPHTTAGDDVADIVWKRIHDIDIDTIALSSIQKAIRRLASLSD